MKTNLVRVLTLLLVLSSILNFYLLEKIKHSSNGYKVVEVYNGDSFTLESRQSVRVANLEAPELNFCLGKEAKKRLKELILGKNVRLEEIRRDKFKRTVALVYVEDVFVNQLLLKEGWGRYHAAGTSQDEKLKAAEHHARDAKRGVHSRRCTQLKPPNPKCAIKGNVEKHYGEKIYHFPGCSGYNVVIVEKDRGEDWFCSEKEAEAAGFKKSEKCYGKKYTPPSRK